MARRLILDTGVLVASQRGLKDLRATIASDDDVVMAAVTLAELQAGVALADDRRRPARAAHLAAVLRTTPVEPYDQAIAAVHGLLLAHVHRKGTPRGAHDLIVAATAAATRRLLVTTDAGARFDELPGVDSIVVAGR